MCLIVGVCLIADVCHIVDVCPVIGVCRVATVSEILHLVREIWNSAQSQGNLYHFGYYEHQVTRTTKGNLERILNV